VKPIDCRIDCRITRIVFFFFFSFIIASCLALLSMADARLIHSRSANASANGINAGVPRHIFSRARENVEKKRRREKKERKRERERKDKKNTRAQLIPLKTFCRMVYRVATARALFVDSKMCARDSLSSEND